MSSPIQPWLVKIELVVEATSTHEAVTAAVATLAEAECQVFVVNDDGDIVAGPFYRSGVFRDALILSVKGEE